MERAMKIVVIGATSAIAEHCTRRWLQRGPVDLTLVGRNLERIERVAADLRVRNPRASIRTVQINFFDSDAICTTVNDIFESGSVDIVLIAHGSLPDQSECQSELHACQKALEINGISPVLFAEAFAEKMMKSNRGTIALIGSVAGDRGRKSNYVYGAAKGLVARYSQGLSHRFAGSGVKVVLIKPGPTDTPMTAHLKAKGAKLATADEVSQQIVKGIDSGKSVIYTPHRWRLIMMIIRHLPEFIFKKLDI